MSSYPFNDIFVNKVIHSTTTPLEISKFKPSEFLLKANMRLSFLEKLQECNKGHKKKVKLVKIIIRCKELKTTLPPYLMVDSRWPRLYYNIRCIYVYKCLNGLVKHDMNFIRQQEQHDYNARTKLNFRLPSVQRNWGKQRTAFHAIKDSNSPSQAIRQSVNLNIFKRNLLNL